jgi:hypothetical protein
MQKTPVEFICDTAFRLKRSLLGAQRVRRVQLYGVGIAKSGTHSLAAMFSHNVRANHEPQAAELVDKIIGRRNGDLSEDKFLGWLRERDHKLALEVDSSALNFQLIDVLLREFPNARFVLTVRDAYSWVNSIMNEFFRGPIAAHWKRMRQVSYPDKDKVAYAPEENVLKENGLFPLETYFLRWATRNTEVIAKIPSERLFIVRTDQIRKKAFELAGFAGLPHYAIRLERTHEYKNPAKKDIIRQIDRDFLERKVEQHCRPLMARFFPEIKSLDDAKL